MTENADPALLQLEAQIVMGSAADQFIKSDLGRYVVARAENDEAEAKDYLAEVSPTDTAKIIEFQTIIGISRGIRSYFAELINDGIEAEHTIDTPEE